MSWECLAKDSRVAEQIGSLAFLSPRWAGSEGAVWCSCPSQKLLTGYDFELKRHTLIFLRANAGEWRRLYRCRCCSRLWHQTAYPPGLVRGGLMIGYQLPFMDPGRWETFNDQQLYAAIEAQHAPVLPPRGWRRHCRRDTCRRRGIDEMGYCGHHAFAV